jgi:toxin ParE1/3/4
MVKKVIYLETAIQDLASIYKYISRDSIKYARLEVEKIKSFCDSLIRHPMKGPYYETKRGKEIRSSVFKNYMIFYSMEGVRVEILSIHHHSRLISNNPAFKDDE